MIQTLFRNPLGQSRFTIALVLFPLVLLALLAGVLVQYLFPECGDFLVAHIGSERINSLVQFLF